MLHLDELNLNFNTYGGISCSKVGITFNGEDYLLKFPGSIKNKNNISSYSNSSISEYLGSKVYEAFGVPVHDVQLVMYKDKLCALCKDFTGTGELVEFRELKSTFLNDSLDTNDYSNGIDTDLDDVLFIIRNQHILKCITNYERFFWTMFVVDALIGNHDRNNGNHGIIRYGSSIYIAPVYDNGGCLNPTWDDSKMELWLSDSEKMEVLAFKANTCCFKHNDKPINPFQLIESDTYPVLTEVLHNTMQTQFNKIEKVINDCEVLSVTQRKFFLTLLKYRYDKLVEISNSISSNVINNYMIKYNVSQDNYKSELTRLTMLSGCKSINELSDYIKQNFL